jgi:predicted secreted hydrolase
LRGKCIAQRPLQAQRKGKGDAGFVPDRCASLRPLRDAKKSKSWISAFLFLVFALRVCANDWRLALPGWRYKFPRDHGAHPDFKTEWWYFTGNLRDERGREFGYQLTWFRHGVRREQEGDPALSRFVVRDLKFAHFTISDLRDGAFYFSEKKSRGAFGEAGFGDLPGRLAWIDDWQLSLGSDGSWEIVGADEGRSVRLTLTPVKAPVIHGQDGVSQKAQGTGHASCYYSFTRMATIGEITLPSSQQSHRVTGESWFDHEWATNQLTPNQIGWNWFSIQLSDRTELMIYQMRTRDGGSDPNSSGTFIAQDGAGTHLSREAFMLTPLSWWKSPRTGARYPIRWRLQIPQLALDLEISTPLENQELALDPIVYWEGAIRVAGTRAGQATTGYGYMELTGYKGALAGLDAPAAPTATK